MVKKDKQMCIGCHSGYYNSKNDKGIKECWLYKSAKVVTRYCLGWWVRPEKVENFTRVVTLNCYSKPGQYAYSEELPKHLAKEGRG